MSSVAENLDSLTYQMSDEEIVELGDRVIQKNEEHMFSVPYTRTEINTLSKLGFYTREELEAENRRLYATREWEKYI